MDIIKGESCLGLESCSGNYSNFSWQYQLFVGSLESCAHGGQHIAVVEARIEKILS